MYEVTLGREAQAEWEECINRIARDDSLYKWFRERRTLVARGKFRDATKRRQELGLPTSFTAGGRLRKPHSPTKPSPTKPLPVQPQPQTAPQPPHAAEEQINIDDMLTVAAVAETNAAVTRAQQTACGGWLHEGLEGQHQRLAEEMQDRHEEARVFREDLPAMDRETLRHMPAVEAVEAEMAGLEDAVRDLSDGSTALLAAHGVGDEVIASMSAAQLGMWEQQTRAMRSHAP